MSAAPKFTAGPWQISDRGRIIETPDGFAVAMTNLAASTSIAEANARLIAAAPELYAALKLWGEFCRNNYSPDTRDGNYHSAMGPTLAALAKVSA
jgi:hypothetical protein